MNILILVDTTLREGNDFYLPERARARTRKEILLFRVQNVFHVLNFGRDVSEEQSQEIYNAFSFHNLKPKNVSPGRGSFIFDEETIFRIGLMMNEFLVVLEYP